GSTTYTDKVPDVCVRNRFDIERTGAGTNSKEFALDVKEAKLEKGSTDTPYTPAPADIEDNSQSVNDFDSISQKATVDGESAVDGIESGGRNLFSVNQYVSLRNSEGTTHGNRYSVGSSGALVVDGVDGSGGYDTMKMVDLKANTEYIFTFNI